MGFLHESPTDPFVGPEQTVGRAERTAALFALRLIPRGSLAVSDLSSSAVDGQGWDPELEMATSTYADIWRQIFKTTGKKDRPDFYWCSARKSADEFMKMSAHPWEYYLGNALAYRFAELGASMCAVAYAVEKKWNPTR